MPDLDRERLERLIPETFVRRAIFYDKTDSTNTRALRMFAEQGVVETPLLLAADVQTGGRGRGANQWWTPAGALAFSLILNTGDLGLAADLRPQVSLVAGLSLLETVRQHLPRANFAVKWPNDVFLEGRKLAGILVEIPPEGSDYLVIGMGVNVNNAFDDAPQPLKSTAVSLQEIGGQEFDRGALLRELLQLLEHSLGALARNEFRLADRWGQHCLLTGKQVTIDAGPNRVAGLCLGIDRTGALAIQTPQGIERLFGGVVAEWE